MVIMRNNEEWFVHLKGTIGAIKYLEKKIDSRQHEQILP